MAKRLNRMGLRSTSLRRIDESQSTPNVAQRLNPP
jgi:hypothetical protein